MKFDVIILDTDLTNVAVLPEQNFVHKLFLFIFEVTSQIRLRLSWYDIEWDGNIYLKVFTSK